jgi:hypothetical protein
MHSLAIIEPQFGKGGAHAPSSLVVRGSLAGGTDALGLSGQRRPLWTFIRGAVDMGARLLPPITGWRWVTATPPIRLLQSLDQ